MIAYADDPAERMPHLAFVAPNFDPSRPVPVRIHSECMTGDVFGSRRCDCGEQLDISLKITAERGGVVIYLRQEGRGLCIGFYEKPCEPWSVDGTPWESGMSF